MPVPQTTQEQELSEEALQRLNLTVGLGERLPLLSLAILAYVPRISACLAAGRLAAWLGSPSSALAVVLAPPATWLEAVELHQAGQGPRRPAPPTPASSGPLQQLQQGFRWAVPPPCHGRQQGCCWVLVPSRTGPILHKDGTLVESVERRHDCVEESQQPGPMLRLGWR